MVRADKQKNIDKVAASVAKDPLQSQREIAEDTGLSIGNVNDKLKDVEQYAKNDDRIQSLLDWDVKLMKKIAKIKNDRLDNPKDINNSDIDKWEQTATKRTVIFGDKWDKDEGDRIINIVI